MKLICATISGVDDLVSPESLYKLQKNYPFVEFGILLSRKRAGAVRYPSEDWMKEIKKYELTLSGHLCGSWVRTFISGNSDIVNDIPIWDSFSRIQLNLFKKSYDISDKTMGMLFSINKQFIFQICEENKDMFYKLKNSDVNIVPFFDNSGGNGVLPDEWTIIDNFQGYCGFAGGLNPDNLQEQLHKINKLTKNDIWIDIESGVRTNDKFDLKKAEKCLEICAKFAA